MVEIESLAGAVCKLFIPWDSGARLVTADEDEMIIAGRMAEWTTKVGQKFRLIKG
jgi:hypothetical protein